MTQALLAYLHYLSIFVLFALLSIEHVQFRLPLEVGRARRLIFTDLAFGLTASLVLTTGVIRVIWGEKGWEYYLHNGFFQAKIGLFILVSLLSITPTLVFLSWRNTLKAGQVPTVSDGQARLVIMAIRLELFLLLLIPLLAVFMARGYGYSA